MSDYITVRIDKDDALNALVDRVRYWTDDCKVIELFSKMYEDYIWNGCFDGGDFDIMSIVDNDWVNYTAVISQGDEDFDYYKINFIESVDDDEDPTMFLVRL